MTFKIDKNTYVSNSLPTNSDFAFRIYRPYEKPEEDSGSDNTDHPSLPQGTSRQFNNNYTIAVVAESTYNNSKGRVMVFEFSGGTWVQRGEDIPSPTVLPESSYNEFGKIISIGNPSVTVWELLEIYINFDSGTSPGTDEQELFYRDGDFWNTLPV